LRDGVLDRAKQDVERAKQSSDDALNLFCTVARSVVTQSNTSTQALMREIAGQGPQKTLSRGFALVRSPSGEPLTRAAQITSGAVIEIQFSDGQISAITGQKL
jgi:exodeoxyribonuclease VII large subunit